MADADVDNCASTYPLHDCFVWNRKHYRLTPDYVLSQCGTCGRITGFRWRSWRLRLRSLFTSEPYKSTVEE